METTMTANTGVEPAQGPQARPPRTGQGSADLDVRYGEIGIVAVAAALRYSGVGKRRADAPATRPIDQRFIERSF
jgi:hypothetical protein